MYPHLDPVHHVIEMSERAGVDIGDILEVLRDGEVNPGSLHVRDQRRWNGGKGGKVSCDVLYISSDVSTDFMDRCCEGLECLKICRAKKGGVHHPGLAATTSASGSVIKSDFGCATSGCFLSFPSRRTVLTVTGFLLCDE